MNLTGFFFSDLNWKQTRFRVAAKQRWLSPTSVCRDTICRLYKRGEYLTLHILSANNNDRAESDSSNETLNQIQIDTNESFMEMKREREK